MPLAYAYNPNYFWGRDWEDHSLGQVVHKTPSQQIAGHGGMHLSSTMQEAEIRSITVLGKTGQKFWDPTSVEKSWVW
jgi:hypothetical protein